MISLLHPCAMLPVHKRWREDYNRKEALWKRSISLSHKCFCSCPDYRLHFTQECLTDIAGAGGVPGVSPAEGISFVTEAGSGGGGSQERGGGSESKR
nr:MAG: ORF2 [Torque teno polar bear virus 29]